MRGGHLGREMEYPHEFTGWPFVSGLLNLTLLLAVKKPWVLQLPGCCPMLAVRSKAHTHLWPKFRLRVHRF